MGKGPRSRRVQTKTVRLGGCASATRRCSIAFNTMTYQSMLQQAANNVYARDSIGGAPICGVLPQWFIEQFEEFVALKPEAATWQQSQVESTMASLWVLDPEDLL